MRNIMNEYLIDAVIFAVTLLIAVGIPMLTLM